MHYFVLKKGWLWCEGVRTVDIAKKTGTPVYIYSHRTLVEHYLKMADAFSVVDHLICYSLKANSSMAVIGTLAKLGAGADIVSGGELYRALRAGIPAGKIVYAGVGKTAEEIEAAIRKGVAMFNIESMPEAEEINRIAGRLRKKVNVAFRVNPDVDPDTPHYITTGKKENKFGINISLALNIIIKAHKKLKNLNVTGVHIHIGSQITKVRAYVEALLKISSLIKKLRAAGLNINTLNIGGGLGIIYFDENPATPAEFAGKVLPVILPLGIRVVMEPGRFIVGNAGILLAKVTYIKKGESKKFVIVDAGMNDLIRPSLYDAYHNIVPAQPAGGRMKADIVGPICESGDFFGKNRTLPVLKEGQYLAIMSAGAYGFSMASNYNSRRKPAEVLVKGNKYFVVRKRETYKDLTRGECVPGSI